MTRFVSTAEDRTRKNMTVTHWDRENKKRDPGMVDPTGGGKRTTISAAPLEKCWGALSQRGPEITKTGLLVIKSGSFEMWGPFFHRPKNNGGCTQPTNTHEVGLSCASTGQKRQAKKRAERRGLKATARPQYRKIPLLARQKLTKAYDERKSVGGAGA